MNALSAFLQSALPVVLSASLSAAALVIMLQIIVWAARFRLPPRWCHALWLVVFARLALPVLPEVPRSMTPPKPTPAAVSHYFAEWQPSADAAIVPRPLVDHEEAARGDVVPTPSPSQSEPPAVNTAPPAPPVVRPWNWLEIAALVWASVAAGMLAVMTLAAWKTLRQLRRQSVPAQERAARVFEKLCEELKLRRRPGLAVCPALGVPVVAGLWRPRILLPSRVAEEFTTEQLRHVLAHEMAHLRRGDLWLHSLAAVLQAVHWFNPLVWFAAFRLRAAAERCCDEWALRCLALPEGRSYADTLLRVLEAPGRTRAMPGIAAMAESRSDLRQRIRALAKWGVASRRWALASASFFVVLAFCALTVPGAEKLPPAAAPSGPTGETSVTVLGADRKPLAGAVVRMSIARVAGSPREGEYYPWSKLPGLPKEILTDENGVARIKYPLEIPDRGRVIKLIFSVRASGHVAISRHEITLAQPPVALRLEAATALRVRVFREDKDARVPVPHCLIQQDLVKQDPPWPYGSTWHNQADGSQLCTEFPAGNLRIRAAWHDVATGAMWFSPVKELTLARDKENQLDLVLQPATTLTGSLDVSVPRPVQKGHVCASFLPMAVKRVGEYGLVWQAAAPVAPDGSFAIRECPPDCDAWVAVVCDGYYSTDPKPEQSYGQAATHVAAGRLGNPLSLLMRPTGSVEVAVLGPDGQPAEGVTVAANVSTLGAFSTTYGQHEGYYFKELASVSCDEQRRLAETPPPSTPDNPYRKETGPDGKVRLLNLPGGEITLWAFSRGILELPPEKHAQVPDQWHRYRSVSPKSGEATSITLQMVKVGTTEIPKPPVAQEIFDPRTLRLYRYAPQTAPVVSPNPAIKAEPVAPDEIAGVVLDAKGQPIQGARVRSYINEPDRSYFNDPEKWMKVDDQGRFRYRVKDAKSAVTTDLVRIEAKDCSPLTLTDQPTGVYAFITMKGDTSLSGVIKDAAGNPVKGVTVSIQQDSKSSRKLSLSMPYCRGKTDANGYYRIFAESDYYSLTVYGRELGNCEQREIWLAKGEDTKLDFSADLKLKLIVDFVDAQTFKPVPGAGLRIPTSDTDVELKADGNGRLVVSGLLAGECEFYPLRLPEYARWWCEEAVSPWQRFGIDNKTTKWQRNFDSLSLDPRKATKPFKVFMERGVVIRGRVLDPEGKPVEGATVDPAYTGTDNSLSGDTRFSGKTDAQGRYELRIPASNAAQYNLVAHDGKYKEWRKWANGVSSALRTKPGEVLENMDITLTRPGVIRGVVVDENGKPVPGQRVHTSPVERNENRYYNPDTTTDKDGRFELPFVRPTKQYLWTSNWSDAPRSVAKEHHIVIDVKAGQAVEIITPKYER